MQAAHAAQPTDRSCFVAVVWCHRSGKFLFDFSIPTGYPHDAPKVLCKTKVRGVHHWQAWSFLSVRAGCCQALWLRSLVRLLVWLHMKLTKCSQWAFAVASACHSAIDCMVWHPCFDAVGAADSEQLCFTTWGCACMPACWT